jgi:hypothetical protein
LLSGKRRFLLGCAFLAIAGFKLSAEYD